ncbi:MAG: N utilization substance protein B [Campylobacteraceae bacterium 4484_166]|nr:MAG: N utilization substance protein B [Campylobacteraceae bacterium 4484_166]
MATRTHAREAVVGMLYAYEIGNKDIVKQIDLILEEKKIRNKQKRFTVELFDGVLQNLKLCDEEISSKLIKRGIGDIGAVEKAILRLSVYEMLFSDTQKAVIINEAIELSKILASDSSPKFINAVLDKINR